MNLRVLTPEDWPVWRALRLAALGTDPAAFGSTLADWSGPGDREERWRDRLSLAGSRNLVAEIDGAPVGMATGVPGAMGIVVVLSMWVAPDGRGRGVGDALIEDLVIWARERGAVALSLEVVVGNVRAVALYARNGFVPTGEVTDREARMLRRL